MGIPLQTLLGDFVWCLPQGVTNPDPDRQLLLPLLSKLLIAKFLKPPIDKDASQATIYEVWILWNACSFHLHVSDP